MLDMEFKRSNTAKNACERRRKCGQSSPTATDWPQCLTLSRISISQELKIARRHSTVMMTTTRRVSSVRRRDTDDCSSIELRMLIIHRRERPLLKMVTIDGMILPATGRQWKRKHSRVQRASTYRVWACIDWNRENERRGYCKSSGKYLLENVLDTNDNDIWDEVHYAPSSFPRWIVVFGVSDARWDVDAYRNNGLNNRQMSASNKTSLYFACSVVNRSSKRISRRERMFCTVARCELDSPFKDSFSRWKGSVWLVNRFRVPFSSFPLMKVLRASLEQLTNDLSNLFTWTPRTVRVDTIKFTLIRRLLFHECNQLWCFIRQIVLEITVPLIGNGRAELIRAKDTQAGQFKDVRNDQCTNDQYVRQDFRRRLSD